VYTVIAFNLHTRWQLYIHYSRKLFENFRRLT